MELLKFRAGKRRSATAWPDLGPKQRLIGVDIADSAEELLVEQRTLDRRFTSVKKRNEMFEVDVQRFEACRTETRILRRAKAYDGQSAEATHIDEAQFASGLELQNGVGVLEQ